MTDGGTEPGRVSAVPGIENPPGLAKWLAGGGLTDLGELQAVHLIAGGRSNLTYRLDLAGGQIVLRRPPLGHVLPTAHDMSREYRVLTALSGTAGIRPALRSGHYDQLVSLPCREAGAQVLLPRGVLARREHGLIRFSRLSAALPLPERALPIPGSVEIPEIGLSIVCMRTEGLTPEDAARLAGPYEAFLDAEEAGRSLVVRSRRAGDTFRPLGAPGQARLKKFLIGRKVPLHERDRIPLVTTADGRIAWVVGHRISERFKLREPARCALHLTARADPPESPD